MMDFYDRAAILGAETAEAVMQLLDLAGDNQEHLDAVSDGFWDAFINPINETHGHAFVDEGEAKVVELENG